MTTALWEKEALELSPVFIVGNGRSGTSILYRSLQNHPTFLPAGGPDLVEAKALTFLPSLLRPKDVVPGRLAMFLKSVDALTVVAREIEPLARRRSLVRRLARNSFAPPAPVWLWKAAGEHHVVRRYFLEAQRRRGAKRLVEKTPSYVGCVVHLRIAFPKARFICIIRHPLDVFSSYLKRYQADPEGSARANLTPDAFCRRWTPRTRQAITLARTDPSFLLVRYEDFTNRTESTVRGVLDHVGEPFDEACLLREPDEEPPGYRQALSETAVKAIELLREPVTPESKRWEDYLDVETARSIERRLHDVMAVAGYEPKAIPGKGSRAS